MKLNVNIVDISVPPREEKEMNQEVINLKKICVPGGNVVCPLFLVLIILREWGVILWIVL